MNSLYGSQTSKFFDLRRTEQKLRKKQNVMPTSIQIYLDSSIKMICLLSSTYKVIKKQPEPANDKINNRIGSYSVQLGIGIG